jgi:hypothetical protein
MVRSCYPPPNPQAGGPLIVGCSQLLIQYIRSYPPYLEAVSSILNLRMPHAVVTRELHNLYSSPSIIRMIKSKKM